MQYYSQSNQDKFFDKHVFNGIREKYFLEIGAYDGITFSNTLHFEKFLNWKGICVEPIPTVYDKLSRNRNCECINGCIAEDDGEVEITHVDGPSEMLTGITKNYDPVHAQRIDKELRELGGKKKFYNVKSYNLTNILTKRNVSHVDYCSIDVEGGEWGVLKSIDFDRISFTAFSIENNFDDSLIKEFMVSKGYVFIGKLDADDIYVKYDRNDISALKRACKIFNLYNKFNSLKRKIFKK